MNVFVELIMHCFVENATRVYFWVFHTLSSFFLINRISFYRMVVNKASNYVFYRKMCLHWMKSFGHNNENARVIFFYHPQRAIYCFKSMHRMLHSPQAGSSQHKIQCLDYDLTLAIHRFGFFFVL